MFFFLAKIPRVDMAGDHPVIPVFNRAFKTSIPFPLCVYLSAYASPPFCPKQEDFGAPRLHARTPQLRRSKSTEISCSGEFRPPYAL